MSGIDLHMHTTASDGRSSPDALVREAREAGLATIAVTDHDTTAAWPEVSASARAHGMTAVPGIEISALHAGRDMHMLAYFLDPQREELSTFLQAQREERRRRIFAMLDLLDRLGVAVDPTAIRERANSGTGRALGRQTLAEALLRGGHVRTTAEAFERYLGDGRPAYVPLHGASPRDVLDLVARLGGIVSLAHPGKLRRDELIPDLVKQGLSAIEVYHSDHDPVDVRRYQLLATRYELLVTGGLDYHGPGSGRTAGLGQVMLPRDDFERLVQRAGWSETPG